MMRAEPKNLTNICKDVSKVVRGKRNELFISEMFVIRPDTSEILVR